MIDQVFQIVKTVVNKELRGNVTPAEYNLLAKQVQDSIFREYFEEAAKDKVKENRGLTSKNFADLSLLQRQRIEMFDSVATISRNDLVNPPQYTLPDDLYFIKDNGVTWNGRVIDESEAADIAYQGQSIAAPSETFPTYRQRRENILVIPDTIDTPITVYYLRKPRDPKWTYQVVNGVEMFDNAILDFQDFDLHTSEFSNIVINILSYFGINIREAEVTQYAEGLKQKQEIKEES